jgi:hypothetical protein
VTMLTRTRGKGTQRSQSVADMEDESSLDEVEQVESGSEMERDSASGSQQEDSDDEVNRQKIRMGYRKLLNSVYGEKDTMSSVELCKTTREGELLFQEVCKNPKAREAALDFEFYDLTLQVAVNNANKLTTGFRGYSIDQFIGKMNTLVAEEKFYDNHVKEFIVSEAVGRMFLYGALDREKPIRKQIERKEKDKEEKEVAKPKIVDQNSVEELDMTRRVRTLKKKLDDFLEADPEEEVNLWSFVIENTFSGTVENLFHFAFLAQEGNAKLRGAYDKLTESMIGSSIPPAQLHGGKSKEEVKSQQAVIRLDYKTWREQLDRFSSESPTKKQKLSASSTQ